MKRKKTLLALLLALALLLCGCTETPPPEEPPPEEPAPAPPQPELPTVNLPSAEPDTMFTLQYNASSSRNPFTCDDVFNDQLMSLTYESLFVLDGQLSPRPRLCRSWETEDGITWVLTLREDVYFHDGMPLTAADVVYSLETARASDKFASRLACIASVRSGREQQPEEPEVPEEPEEPDTPEEPEDKPYVPGDEPFVPGDLPTEGEAPVEDEPPQPAWVEDGHTLTITLHYANYLLPALLDTPVVELDTAEKPFPIGTGPYEPKEDRLRAYPWYHSRSETQPSLIYLTEAPVTDLVKAFLDRDLDLLCADPTGLTPMNIYAIHETRSYATTELLYLGFHNQRGLTKDPAFRRALSYLVDRSTICGTIYGGHVTEAPLVLHPQLSCYDASWEAGTAYSRQSFLEAAYAYGLEDRDADGFLEYFDDISLSLVVNEESPYKLEAARRIATDLTNMGIPTKVRALSWLDYLYVLRIGDFDLYLGQTRLTADFDLTPILDSGGTLNYGRVSDGGYRYFIRDLQAASTEQEQLNAAAILACYVRDQAPIVPICFKQYQVLTRVGDISGGTPSQSGLFWDIASWTFNSFQ